MKLISACRFAALLVLMFALSGCGRNREGAAGPPVITASLDPGASYDLSRQIADEFEQRTGVRVRLLRGAADATERLSQYLQVLGAESPDIDIFQIDVIWPATLSHHLIDLKPAFGVDINVDTFFPVLIENNTVDGRLLAVPWFGDAGLLYYRRDLLQKYGFAAPPATWDELDSMAARIQKGEREAGRPDFWGFVWQGKAYEGLTCNALEWQASSDGGTVVEPEGWISVNNPAAAAALQRAAGWVGRISPPGVTTYSEEEGRQLFQGGNAAFMRNWPYAYGLLEAAGSPMKGKTGVARLPTGGTGHAAALGGWQLAVSRYSLNQDMAVEFVRTLTSREVQLRRALKLSQLPSRVALYDDPVLREALPILPLMKEVFLGAVARPSSQTGEDYNEVSTYYFQSVHKVLSGQQTAAQALEDLEKILKEILK